MSALEEKVKTLAGEIYNMDVSFIESALTKFAKEQDRDTRHACAESIIMHTFDDGNDSGYIVTECHRIIMNCRGGIN